MSFIKKAIAVTAVSAAALAVAGIALAAAATTPTPADALTVEGQAGTDPGTTKVTATPDTGDFLMYYLSKASVKTPAKDAAIPANAIYYEPGTDIKADLKAVKYVELYEVDGTTLKVKKFKELEIGTNYKANLAPAIKSIVIAPGTASTTLKLTATVAKGDKLRIFNVDTATTDKPLIGTSVSGTDYVLNSNIAIDLEKDKYLDIMEVDSSGKAVAFSEVAIDQALVTVPVIEEATATVGSKPSTAKITAELNGKTFVYQLALKKQTIIPTFGSALPVGTFPYKSGNDIPNVSPLKNKVVNLYEINAKGKIIAFQSIELTQASIAVPEVTLTSSAKGVAAGSTRFTLKAAAGGTFKVALADTAISTLPKVGDAAPEGAVVYKNGTDLALGSSKYVDVFEVGKDGKVVGFGEIKVEDQATVTAPKLTASLQPVADAPGKTALSVDYEKPSEHILYYAVSAKAITAIPTVGTKVMANTMTALISNAQTTSAATTDKFIDVYELNGEGELISFVELPLTTAVFSPADVTVTVAEGTADGTTKLTLTVAVKGNTFKYAIRGVSDEAPTVKRGDNPPASAVAYTSGNNIANVDSIDNKYIDLYELTSGKVVGYKLITLTGNNIKGGPKSGPVPTIEGATIVKKDIGGSFTINVSFTNSANRHFFYVVHDYDVTEPTPAPNYGDDYWTVQPNNGIYAPDPQTGTISIEKNTKFVGFYETTSFEDGYKIIGYKEYKIADVPTSPL